MVERFVYIEDVRGSSPCARTMIHKHTQAVKLVLLTIAVLIVGLATYVSSFSIRTYPKVKTKMGGETFTLYVADTDARRVRGLSGTKSLRAREGMLFEFGHPGFWSFWMKDMLIPIDIIYVHGTKVVDVKRNVKPETYPATFLPSVAADRVIEVNAGVSTQKGINAGSSVEFLR